MRKFFVLGAGPDVESAAMNIYLPSLQAPTLPHKKGIFRKANSP